MPCLLTVNFGDTAALPRGIEVCNEPVNYSCDKGFVRLVPAVLRGVSNALPVDNPAHIANTMRPQDIWWIAPAGFRKNALDGLHATDEFQAVLRGQSFESSARLVIGKSIE